MSQCGIDIRGRSRKLYLNYRTTDEIRREAVALLDGCEVDDLDDGHDETSRYKSLSHGPAPLIVAVDGLEQAAARAIGFIQAMKSASDAQAHALEAGGLHLPGQSFARALARGDLADRVRACCAAPLV